MVSVERYSFPVGSGPSHGLHAVGMSDNELLPAMWSYSDNQYADGVDQEIGLDAISEQIAGDEDTVVEVEDDKKGEGNDTSVAQVFVPREIEPAPAHDEEREAEDNAPTDNVSQDFDKMGALWQILFHHSGKVKIKWRINNEVNVQKFSGAESR